LIQFGVVFRHRPCYWFVARRLSMKGILRLAVLVGSIGLAGSPSAVAVPFTIDFESQALTSGLTSLVLTSGGVTATLTRSSGATFGITGQAGRPAGFGSRTLEPFSNVTFPAGDSFILTFNVPINLLSIQFGDYGPSDNDTPVGLGAFSGPDGLGVNVANDTEVWLGSNSFPDFRTLSVSSPFTFQSVKFSSAGPFPNSLFWDNIEGDAVPEPGTLVLLGTGITGLAMRRRRRTS
jgi:hypothetical protein